MKTDIKTFEINGVEYVEKNSVNDYKLAEKVSGLEYVLIRSDRAGIFTGYLKEKVSKEKYFEVTLLNFRRIWYWDGAASISQLAMEGTSKPENCKFAMEVSKNEFPDVIEIMPVTEKAKKSIEGVKVWKK